MKKMRRLVEEFFYKVLKKKKRCYNLNFKKVVSIAVGKTIIYRIYYAIGKIEMKIIKLNV